MTSGRSILRLTTMAGGFSTVGALVSLVLAGFILAQLLGMVINSQRGFVQSTATARAAGSARHAQLAITRLLRFAGSNLADPVQQGIDPDPLGNNRFDNIRVRADFNPPDGDTTDPGEDMTFWLQGDTMYLFTGASTAFEPFLIGIDSLAFEYFDRSGAPIVDPAEVAARAALVQLTVRGCGQAHGGKRRELLISRVNLRNGR